MNKYEEADYFVFRNSLHLPDDIRRRTASCIKKYCWQYRVNPLLIAKQKFIESRYKYWDESHKGAYGGAQITLFWKDYLYQCDNGSLGRYFKKIKRRGRKVDYKRYFKRIGYGTECQCKIMRDLIRQYGQDAAIIIYGHTWKTAKFYLKWPGLIKYNTYYRLIMDCK